MLAKAFVTGVVFLLFTIIIALSTGHFDEVGNYTEYLAFGLITLAGLMVYNTLRVPNPYYQEDSVQDHKSRWKWTIYFVVAAVPSIVFSFLFYVIPR